MNRSEGVVAGARTPSPPGQNAAEPKPPTKKETPVATNSWARRTILARAQEIGLPPERGREVGSVALWYYNRIVLLLSKPDAINPELPYDTNRYLVPITLALACEQKKHGIELEQLLRLSEIPTKRTIATAYELRGRYSRMLATARRTGSPTKGTRAPIPAAAAGSSRPVASAGAPARTVGPPRAVPKAAPAATHTAPAAAAPTAISPPTALAIPPSDEIARLRNLFGTPRAASRAQRPPTWQKQPNTNAWARKRIGEVSASLKLPERVRKRALGFYEQIVDLHTAKGSAPPGKRLQLSPRLNWSLVYTTIYLGCRIEEYPKDLREILGRSSRQGAFREIYGLYRFYKRELGISVKLVDVRTFILSWFDGFDMSELIRESGGAKQSEGVKNRALDIANLARGDKSLENTSTKIIAAGALTTALAENDPPGNRASFYRAVAAFLHMSEGTLRYIVTRISRLP
jgi:transcription initiation factor TFIIIB Brf1 subunit/transcription initiation factor TFIIB